jgi:membrane-bound lytic murein transglycosylase F
MEWASKHNREPKQRRSGADRRGFLLLFFVLGLLSGCSDKSGMPDPISRDMEQIVADGTLRALTTFSGTSYFIYRGQPMGFEYELLQRFAGHQGLNLEIVVTQHIDSLFHMLNRGDADIVAHGLAITLGRKEFVSFSDYFYLSHQVLVQRKPQNWRDLKLHQIRDSLVTSPIDLIGQTVSVRKNSSYVYRLQNLSREMGGIIHIDTLSGSLATDEIIRMVVDGEIRYTVADNNIAHINAAYYPDLDVEVPISFSQRMGWAVRPNSPELLKAINAWLKDFKKTIDYHVIYDRYFENKRRFIKRNESEFYSLYNDKISPYDSLIKVHADTLGWDWRLLASLIYQESQFNPSATSWAGARGLMQIMPATAKELGIRAITDPFQNLEGGTTYLKQLWQRFDNVEDITQRIKLTMAAYNCGYHHVLDAQTLADKRELDPEQWDDHVETVMLDLSYPKHYNDPVVQYGYVRGSEPVAYVKEIFDRYWHYVQLISPTEGEEDEDAKETGEEGGGEKMTQ